MMEDEVVSRRGWLTREQFLDYVGATNLIPGPNSTELAIHIGHARAGWPGLLVAGSCFIVPAAAIVAVIAWAYVRFGALPEAAGLLYGIKPVVIAIVAQALWRLGRVALKRTDLLVIGAAGVAALVAGVNELLVLAGSAVAAVLSAERRNRPGSPPGPGVAGLVAAVGVAGGSAVGAAAAIPQVGLWPLFVVFARIGSVLFGSGYVLLAFLRSDLVERLGWLTEQQILDATAVGQVTPGPLFTTATFVGYLLAGPRGALVATAGIFVPAFIFVAISGPLVPRLRRSARAGAALDGVNAGSLALMALVSWQLGRAALVDAPAWLLAAAAMGALIRFRVNSAWLVAAGGAAGLLKMWAGG
jgi:chromate transporter